MGLIGDIFTGLGSRDAAKNAASSQVNAEVQAGTLLGQAGGLAQNQVATNYNQARDTYNPYVAGGAGAINGMSVGALGGWASNPYQAALPTPTASNNPYGFFSNSAEVTNSPYAVLNNPYQTVSSPNVNAFANPYATTNANTAFNYDAKSLANDPSYQFTRDQSLQA